MRYEANVTCSVAFCRLKWAGDGFFVDQVERCCKLSQTHEEGFSLFCVTFNVDGIHNSDWYYLFDHYTLRKDTLVHVMSVRVDWGIGSAISHLGNSNLIE